MTKVERRYTNNPTARRLRKHRALALCVAGYGGSCHCCGERNSTYLLVKAVTSAGVLVMQSARRNTESTYRKIIRSGFPDDFIVRCANCQIARQRGETCSHPGGKNETT